MSDAYYYIDGDTFRVHCPHGKTTAVRTHDPTLNESELLMLRTALQRHVVLCGGSCTLPLWDEWFHRLRQSLEANGRQGTEPRTL